MGMVYVVMGFVYVMLIAGIFLAYHKGFGDGMYAALKDGKLFRPEVKK